MVLMSWPFPTCLQLEINAVMFQMSHCYARRFRTNSQLFLSKMLTSSMNATRKLKTLYVKYFCRSYTKQVANVFKIKINLDCSFSSLYWNSEQLCSVCCYRYLRLLKNLSPRTSCFQYQHWQWRWVIFCTFYCSSKYSDKKTSNFSLMILS